MADSEAGEALGEVVVKHPPLPHPGLQHLLLLIGELLIPPDV